MMFYIPMFVALGILFLNSNTDGNVFCTGLIFEIMLSIVFQRILDFKAGLDIYPGPFFIFRRS